MAVLDNKLQEKIDDLTEKQTSFQNEIETSLINRFEASPGVQIIKSKESPPNVKKSLIHIYIQYQCKLFIIMLDIYIYIS